MTSVEEGSRRRLADWAGLGGAFARALPKLFVHLISALFPRSRRVWVFYCWDGKRFSDNAKWLFLHCARQGGADVVPVFFTRSPGVLRLLRAAGLRSCRPKSPEGWWWRLRAGVYILDNAVGDQLFWGSARAVKINLWHGIPLKKIGRDIDAPGHVNVMGFRGALPQRVRFRLEHPWDAVRYDMMIATSPEVARRFSGAFGIPESRIPVTGFPRNDVLLEHGFCPGPWDQEMYRRAKELVQEGKKLVFYLPTFRAQRQDAGWGDVDGEELEKRLEEWDAVWVFKPHTWETRLLMGKGQADRVWALDTRVDVYPLLRLADVLVTDYSSIYFDFLLLDRPIVFYAHDLDRYMREERGFYDRYEDAAPGPIVTRFSLLLDEVGLALEQPEDHLERWRDRREAVRRACHGFRDAGAAERVAGEILRRFVRQQSENGRGGVG